MSKAAWIGLLVVVAILFTLLSECQFNLLGTTTPVSNSRRASALAGGPTAALGLPGGPSSARLCA